MSPRTKMNFRLSSNPGSAEAGGMQTLETLGTTAPVQWLSSMVPCSTTVPCSCSTPEPPPVKAEGGAPGKLQLNGIDGVKTKVTNKYRVKITLGHRVVNTLDVWVGNIGQGIDVLLGMNFMVATEVRLCAHEGEVVLPDEERILLVGGPKRSHLGRTIDVSIHESLWLAPGDSKYIPIWTSEPDLGSMDWFLARSESRSRSGGEHFLETGPGTSAYQGCHPHRSGSVTLGDQLRAPGILLSTRTRGRPQRSAAWTLKFENPNGESDPEEEERLRAILRKHRTIFFGEGNALPPPVRGVVCDLEVGDAKPISMRSRRIPADLLSKVYELVKRLLGTCLIEYSDSEWASAIVLVMKKKGADVGLCIDSRLVNQLIKLMNLPPTPNQRTHEQLRRHYVVHDSGHGKWVLGGSNDCPLGLFQWKRMPFGLKNAPLIDQQLLDNYLWGFVRLPLEEERPEVLEFLGISPEDLDAPASQGTKPRGVVSRTSTNTVFHQNRVAPEQMEPVLSRSSYIDDTIYGAPSWDDLCKTLNALLYRLRYWNISVSLPKSEFGVKKCKRNVLNLPFTKTRKGVQSFLGSLNYFAKFIEDLPVLAATRYETSDEQLRS
ncbi:reverse transcriptase [Phytophthora megakarya]|uniref:Reverse transcriptase n=1 Tax=Phytophthora megakarya TaxID=4795 RepID=A0A225W863_9STRA|nr:reverse transcriptase [Phytophthora megakarya]